MYTAPGGGRVPVETQAKLGHVKWQQGDHFWKPGQVWECPSETIYLAAGRAHDKSRRGTRNTIAPEAVPSFESQ
ncbi:MAG: hypothetical protein NT069_05760 [Planctomycetota bacterium]|nr:hypothetical protein [Planctomycetota bacterium]